MTTKEQLIETLKLQFPTLQIGNDNDGYTDLSQKEYDTKIEQWADAKLLKIKKESELERQKIAKLELLNRLGITEEEAKLLLS